MEPTFAPVLAWECLALIASESWVEASLKNHSLVVVAEAILSFVDGKVATVSIAVVKVAVLKDGSGKVEILLEGVNVKVAVLEAWLDLVA